MGVLSDFPTAPDFNEILMDGTVFFVDSNGMFVLFEKLKMKKLQLFKVIFSYLFLIFRTKQTYHWIQYKKLYHPPKFRCDPKQSENRKRSQNGAVNCSFLTI